MTKEAPAAAPTPLPSEAERAIEGACFSAGHGRRPDDYGCMVMCAACFRAAIQKAVDARDAEKASDPGLICVHYKDHEGEPLGLCLMCEDTVQREVQKAVEEENRECEAIAMRYYEERGDLLAEFIRARRRR